MNREGRHSGEADDSNESRDQNAFDHPNPILESSRVTRYEIFDSVNEPYVRWQVEQLLPYVGERVLEIGCGVGSVLAQLGPRERVVGLDIDPEVLAVARTRFEGHVEMKFIDVDAENISSSVWIELMAQRFDTILSVNHIEHIRDDLTTARRAFDLLAPGGAFCVLTPAHQALYGPYDALDGHFRRYSRRSLRKLLEDSGFSLERIWYFNMVGALGWWVKYKFLRRRIHGEGEFGIMNRIVPIMKPIEKMIWAPFGLSVIAIARKE